MHDGSDGKAENLRLNDPEFKPQPSQVKIINIFSYFWLVALEPMRSTSI